MNDPYYDPVWKALRVIVIKRDGHKCVFCNRKVSLRVHHFRPLKKGGVHDLFNLITLCAACHSLDHQFIKEWGCCTIPGPDWEPYREILTIPEDVDRYREYLIFTGHEPEF